MYVGPSTRRQDKSTKQFTVVKIFYENFVTNLNNITHTYPNIPPPIPNPTIPLSNSST